MSPELRAPFPAALFHGARGPERRQRLSGVEFGPSPQIHRATLAARTRGRPARSCQPAKRARRLRGQLRFHPVFFFSSRAFLRLLASMCRQFPDLRTWLMDDFGQDADTRATIPLIEDTSLVRSPRSQISEHWVPFRNSQALPVRVVLTSKSPQQMEWAPSAPIPPKCGKEEWVVARTLPDWVNQPEW